MKVLIEKRRTALTEIGELIASKLLKNLGPLRNNIGRPVSCATCGKRINGDGYVAIFKGHPNKTFHPECFEATP